MSIDIKKTGKNTYYRKDGNKMGGRKEKQEMLNISIKHFEKDFEERHRHSSKFLPGWSSFDKILSGGIKRGEMAVMGACCAMPGDEYRNNMALAAMHHVDRSKVVMIGMEHEFDHTDRLVEEFKHHMDYMPYFKDIPLVTSDGIPHDVITKMKDIPKRINILYGGERPNTIMIDEVPYNPMDEFDRPEFYGKDIEVVSDGCGSMYPKNPEDVLSEQFKIDINNKHQKDVTNAINNMINVNKAYSMVIDNEGRQLYPETNMCLEGVSIKNVPDDLKEEWYMKKSKITLIIPDWMIEPKDVYTYMSMAQISDEEKEDNKEDLINMISEFNQKVTKHKIKKLLTDIIISLDWDDVMYHLMQKNIEFVEKEYGIKDVHLEITDYYYLYRTYPKIADELWNHPENYITGKLVEGAKEFYQELVNLVGEDKIQIVTSSMENVIPLKDKMLRDKFNINCKIVHSVFGKHKKYEFTKDTILIDDFVGNVREHFIHNMDYGIVFNHMNLEYIKQECIQEGYVHVTTFEEVIEKVKIYLELLNNKEHITT